MEDLPIDIQTGKLVDWLISRRHVKKNWPEMVLNVREKINAAIQDMPEHAEIIKLLSGSYINYFHCLRIIEILSETEKESKNIFGWYTSQRMKDWKAIVNLYETDNIYLGEASQYLVRNVNYELPSLKKQMVKQKQIQEDCDKKTQDTIKGSALEKEKYFSSCKQIGITGDNIKEELNGLLNKLPEKFQSVGERTKDLKEACQFYEDYVHFIVSSNRTCLPLLKFLIENGDVTLYEWKYGEPPVTIEKESILLPNDVPELESAENDEIDFGDELEVGNIDWGNFDTETNPPDIDFGEDDNVAEIVVESSGMEGGIATGQEALTLLHNETTRIRFINELMELEGFLSQRIVELESEENILSLSLFSNCSKSLQYQNTETFAKYLQIMSEIIADLSSIKMKHLYMIGSSPRYVDRLILSLESHLRTSDRMLASVEDFKKKREAASVQLQSLLQHHKLIVGRTKELQENIELEISKKYQNRPVNLMGGVSYI